jgi:hypothetical protein
MSKSILQAALVALLTTGVASAQTPALVPVSVYGAPKADFGVKVFPVADLVNPPKGSPLANPGDDEAMKAATEAYSKVRVTALKAEILKSIDESSWAENYGTASLEYFATGQSLLVINTPSAIAKVEQHIDTLRLVKNTFVQVEVKLFKVPSDTDSVKKVFGDKVTATMTAEEAKTLLDGLTKSGQMEVISAPKVTVSNKQTGVFEMLQQLPKDNRSVGVSCRMTPDVANDAKTIRLKVDVTNSTPSSALVDLGNGLKVQPVDSQQTCATLAMVNGGTCALRLGIHKVEQKIEQKVPVLGDLPYLDRLFRNTAIAVLPVETIAVFTVSQVKPAVPSAVLPPLPPATMPHYLQHPPTQLVEPVQAVLPLLPAPTTHLLSVHSFQPVPASLPKLMPRPVAEPTLADYHAACAAGQKDEALYLARQLLKKDPTCFASGK